MKQILSILLAWITCACSLAQNPLEPCCGIIKRNSTNKTVLARDNTTGQLYQFSVADMNSVKPGDPVSISQNKIVAVNNIARTYVASKPDYIEPCCGILSIEPDPLDPCCAMVTYKNNSTGALSKFKAPKNITGLLKAGDPVYTEPVAGINLKNAEPVGVTNKQKNGLAPCCSVVSVQPDPVEPCCSIVTYKNNSTGVVSKVRMNKALGPVHTGESLYAEPVSDFAIVQPANSINNEMNSYGYPASSAEETGDTNGNETDKWVISPVQGMKGVLGKLNTNFPEGVEWSIDVKTTENKFITNRSSASRQNYYDIAPGNYNIRLNTITVENVPVEKGKETRLKAGYLNIVSSGEWSLYDESKQKFHTSGNKAKKIALPVGNYQLKLGGQFFSVNIKDKKTIEM